jgi:hypothetical protein
MTTVVIRPMGKTSDEIAGKAGNETRQVRTHNRAPSTSPKLKSLQDLSTRVNPEVTKDVVHHVGHPSDARVIRSLPPRAQPGQPHN